jgi:hypothetical protein
MVNTHNQNIITERYNVGISATLLLAENEHHFLQNIQCQTRSLNFRYSTMFKFNFCCSHHTRGEVEMITSDVYETVRTCIDLFRERKHWDKGAQNTYELL